jgi:hypothetical protein
MIIQREADGIHIDGTGRMIICHPRLIDTSLVLDSALMEDTPNRLHVANMETYLPGMGFIERLRMAWRTFMWLR